MTNLRPLSLDSAVSQIARALVSAASRRLERRRRHHRRRPDRVRHGVRPLGGRRESHAARSRAGRTREQRVVNGLAQRRSWRGVRRLREGVRASAGDAGIPAVAAVVARLCGAAPAARREVFHRAARGRHRGGDAGAGAACETRAEGPSRFGNRRGAAQRACGLERGGAERFGSVAHQGRCDPGSVSCVPGARRGRRRTGRAAVRAHRGEESHLHA